MMNFIRMLFLSCVMLVFSCSSPTSTGNGTGTDAGDARICGIIRSPDNKAAANVTVTLRKQDYLPYSVSYQDQVKTVSGKDGAFAFPIVPPGYYLVDLLGSDSLRAMKRFSVSDADTVVQLGDLVVDTLEAISGTVLSEGVPAAGGTLLVMGMDIQDSITVDGSFSLRLPSGDQLFRITTGSGPLPGDVLFSGKGGEDDTIRVAAAPLTVLDDFNNMDGLNSLTGLLGGGGWFAFTDTVNGGGSTILPTEEPGLVAAIDTTAAAYSGGSLHCTFTIDQNFSAPFALIGVDISSSKVVNSSKSWFDLSAMTALSFMAKGSGVIHVQFTCKPVGDATDYLIYQVPVTLPAGWGKCTINAADIPAALGSSVDWKTGCVAVSNINFLASSTVELWMDDLTVEGVNVTDFLR